jgi:hypothetical protein
MRAKRRKISARSQAQWPMNIGSAGKKYGTMHSIASALFQDDSKQYVRENPTKAVFTALGVGFVLGLIFPSLGTVDGRPPDVRLRSCLRGRYGPATGLRLADYKIMAIATQKEKFKQQEQSRDFFCVVSDAFRLFARRSSMVLGSAWAFGGAILIIVVWGLTGPMFHYSDTWQLIINTGTTIVTFPDGLSHSEYTESRCQSAHLKLDEVIRALKGRSK